MSDCNDHYFVFASAKVDSIRKAGDGPNASEVYLMSRGNPYGTDSFPAHERQTRNLLALTNGGLAAVSLGWPGHEASTRAVLQDVTERAPWLTRTRSLPWAALLVSEQTRQFYAYKDIQERFLPHVFGAFRAATEEHLPLSIINDWDLNPPTLARYAVLVLPNAAARLSSCTRIHANETRLGRSESFPCLV